MPRGAFVTPSPEIPESSFFHKLSESSVKTFTIDTNLPSVRQTLCGARCAAGILNVQGWETGQVTTAENMQAVEYVARAAVKYGRAGTKGDIIRIDGWQEEAKQEAYAVGLAALARYEADREVPLVKYLYSATLRRTWSAVLRKCAPAAPDYIDESPDVVGVGYAPLHRNPENPEHVAMLESLWRSFPPVLRDAARKLALDEPLNARERKALQRFRERASAAERACSVPDAPVRYVSPEVANKAVSAPVQRPTEGGDHVHKMRKDGGWRTKAENGEVVMSGVLVAGDSTRTEGEIAVRQSWRQMVDEMVVDGKMRGIPSHICQHTASVSGQMPDALAARMVRYSAA